MEGLRGCGVEAFERAAGVFALLSASSRLRILTALCDGELCVGSVATAVELPQSTVSQQLSLLYRAGLVARRKEGPLVHYRVEPRVHEFLCRSVHALVE